MTFNDNSCCKYGAGQTGVVVQYRTRIMGSVTVSRRPAARGDEKQGNSPTSAVFS
jgi:hypothetical protein